MRTFSDSIGLRWTAETISHGRTSGYLNAKVHRPVVQFSCLDERGPKKYASLPRGREAIDALSDAELVTLLLKAEVH